MPKTSCPSCGATIYLSADKPRRDWREYTSQAIAFDRPRIIGTDQQRAGLVETRSPAAQPTWQGNVVVPTAQACVVGIMAWCGTMGATIFWAEWPLRDALSTTFVASVAGFAASWIYFTKSYMTGLWRIERTVGRDLNGDSFIGRAPEPEVAQAVRIPFKRETESGYSWSIFDLPLGVGEVAFKNWAADVLAGTSLAIGVWEREFPGNAYRKLVGQLAKHGMAEDMGGNKGYRLTDYGAQALREYVKK